MTASGNNSKSDETKSAILLHVAGPEALKVYNGFTWDEDGDAKKVGKIFEKLQAYCTPRKNVTWDRHIFSSRTQLPDLHSKAENREFGTLSESLIRDRIICAMEF